MGIRGSQVLSAILLIVGCWRVASRLLAGGKDQKAADLFDLYGVSIAMGVPKTQNRWFISWKIPLKLRIIIDEEKEYSHLDMDETGGYPHDFGNLHLTSSNRGIVENGMFHKEAMFTATLQCPPWWRTARNSCESLK